MKYNTKSETNKMYLAIDTIFFYGCIGALLITTIHAFTQYNSMKKDSGIKYGYELEILKNVKNTTQCNHLCMTYTNGKMKVEHDCEGWDYNNKKECSTVRMNVT